MAPHPHRLARPTASATSIAGASALLVSLATTSPAACAAPTFALAFSSEAQYSSSLYDAPLIRQDRMVASVPAWNTMGRVGGTELTLLPTTVTGARLDEDQARTWTRFVQPAGANATLRAYAFLGGYYMDANPPSLARSEMQVRNTLEVHNGGTTGAQFDLMQLTHGVLMAGGPDNNAVAYAEESTFVRMTCRTTFGCVDDAGGLITVHEAGWGGDARVSTTRDGDLVAEVHGAWAGNTFRRFKDMPGYDVDPIEGIELGLVYFSAPIYLAAGATLEVELDYLLRVAAFADSARSGFLTIAETDFSATAQLQWRALDPLTGLPAQDVVVRLVDDDSTPGPNPVPLPSTALMALAALALRFKGVHR